MILGVNCLGLDTSNEKMEDLTQNVRGEGPTQFFFLKIKVDNYRGLHAKNHGLSSKTVDLHPTLNFSYIWLVNLIRGQTKGQNPISIAEMDSLGSIT